MKEILIAFVKTVGICAAIFGTACVFASLKIGGRDADCDAASIMKRHTEETAKDQTGEAVNELARETARAPNRPRKFYSIEEQDDGTVDVYLCPDLVVYDTDLGIKEYDIDLRVIHGIVPWDGLEEDIRERFRAWCESAARINI